MLKTCQKGTKPAAQPAHPVSTELITAESLLIDLIHSSGEAESWSKTGCGPATCDIIGGLVVARTTPASAERLQLFLDD